MACLHVVIVDGLLSEERQVELILLHDMAEDLGDGERLQLLIYLHVCHHVDTFVGAHSQRVPYHINRPNANQRDVDVSIDIAGDDPRVE